MSYGMSFRLSKPHAVVHQHEREVLCMKNRYKVSGIIVMMAVIGLFVGCDNGTNSVSVSDDPKSITVTGLEGFTGYKATIYVDDEQDDLVTGSYYNHIIVPSNGSATFALIDGSSEESYENRIPWTGQGSYYIVLEFTDSEGRYQGDTYYYTNGRELNSSEDNGELYNITDMNTIPFSKFKLTLNEH